MSAVAERTVLRVDIQLLRAVAVLFVVGFHLWPHTVVGGFVGVDIFFVISGFLITTHLVTEAQARNTIGLRQFWARRARRLLPSAYLVVLVTSVLVFLYQPSAMWLSFIRQAVASTFYVENWALAADATNYLAADKPPTAVQQYWSLSAEEQFYIVWPLLILLAILLVRRWRGRGSFAATASVLGVVSAASLVYSVVAVWQGQSVAYFSTWSRAWEFGAGGLLAVWMAWRARAGSAATLRPQRTPVMRIVLALLGWIGLAVSLAIIRDTTPFPGLWALLPVVATAMIIGANVTVPARLARLLTPAVWIGGISYALYLWHWPLIVIYPFALHHEPSLGEKIGILALTVLLAWVTTRWVEAPIRRWNFLASPKTWRTAVLGLGVAGIVLAPAIGVGVAQDAQAQRSAEVAQVLATDSCFGARAIDAPETCASRSWSLLQPDPSVAENDRAELYDHNCISETSSLLTCSFGNPQGAYRVALIGDSHAASWFPAVESAFAESGASITTFTKFSCVFSSAPRSADYGPCTAWGNDLSARLSELPPFDLVVVTGYATNLREDIQRGVLSPDQATAGFADKWRPLIARGSRVVVLHDNPEWPETPSLCLTQVPDPAQCDAPRAQFEAQTDYQFEAAKQIAGVYPLDLSRYFCTAASCFTTAGGVTVYLDRSHISKTYAGTLGPILARELDALGLTSR